MHMHRALIIAAMKRNDVARAAGAALVFLAAAAVPVAGALAATAKARKAEATAMAKAQPILKVAPVVYRERRLGNGLQVITVENRSSPTVSVQVWYHVGSRDDPAGRSGFAHLFEHMMFKSTTNLRAEQFDRLTEDVGGANNASTGDDVTEYHEVVPSNHLETLLWAEAERMMNLKVDEANFKSERAVVEEEYRQRVLASPYGRLFNAFSSASYLEHPYKRPGIGSIEDLEASTLSDVVDFHVRHYRPDNATLVVAGDFDQKQLDAWIDKYFAPVPKPAAPLPRFDASEPPWQADRVAKVTGPQVPLPAVALSWLAPPVTSPDNAALQVAAAVLASGESSRLNQSLVYRQRVATQAGFNADLRAGPGLLIAYAIAAGGKSPADVGAALLAEVTRLATTPPSAAELAKVKTQLVTQAFTSRQTPLGLASAIAEAAVMEGDAGRVNTDLDDLQRVSATDVQRVMRRYVVDARKVTIDYRQEEVAKK
jgi:zinc protease